MEYDPRYVDVAIKRWESLTKLEATLAGDGRTFDEITASRLLQSERRSCARLSRDQRKAHSPESYWLHRCFEVEMNLACEMRGASIRPAPRLIH
jgi:hypothetical protein